MIAQIGQIVLILSFVLLLPICNTNVVVQTRAFYMHAVMLVIAAVVLVAAFIANDFSLLYVAAHSHADLPLFYRIVAMWGGHSGSLLLFVVMMSTWMQGSLSKLEGELKQKCLRHYALVVGGLLLIVLLVSNPFVYTVISAQKGQSLNPLLQDFGMSIHPPILYLGYVSGLFPFLLALSDHSLSPKTQFLMKESIRYGIAILTIGILLGSWWAYRVLGWGGYWGWDPVENASLLPWISLIGLYHALLSGHRRWIRLFACIAFISALLSTTLIRSGLMDSVHSFSVDINVMLVLGLYTLMLSVLSFKVCLMSNDGKAWWPFKLHMFLSLFVVVMILLTLILPMITDYFNQGKLVFDAAFFNKAFTPVIVIVLFGMVMYWPRSISALVVSFIMFMIYGLVASDWVGAILIGLGGYAVHTGLNHHMNLAHMGFVCMLFAIVFNAHFSSYHDVVIYDGDKLDIDGMTIQLDHTTDLKKENYIEKQAHILIDGATYNPSIRYYPDSDMSVGKVDVRIGLMRERYIALGAIIEDAWSFRVHDQFMLRWIWAFAVMMAVGVVYQWRNR